MRNFINIVTEATRALPASLYHGTAMLALAGILADDSLTAAQRDDSGPEGVSFSTDPQIAVSFAHQREDEAQEMEYPGEFRDISSTAGAVIEVDASKVKAHGKLRRIEGRDSSGTVYENEAEYRLYGSLSPLSQVLIAIHCNRADIDATIRMLQSVTEHSYYVDRAHVLIEALERLKTSPLLK